MTRRLSQSRRGNSFVDYLMITLVVAAVGVPVMMNYFGEPIRRSLYGNRKNLVDFLAQTPKRKVPNFWFASERAAQIAPPNAGGVGPLPDPGEVGKAPNVKGPGTINQPNIAPPGDIPPPNVTGGAAGAGGGGGGVGGAGGAGGGGLGSNDAASGDFFAKKDGSNNADGDKAGVGSSRTGGGSSIEGDEDDSSGGRGGGGVGKGGTKGNQDSSKGASEAQSRKYQNDQVQRIAEDERRKAGAFNWWLIIRILIILLIFFLVMLIILGSKRR